MSKKSPLRECFNKQYGKRAQGLLKPASQHLYHIHSSLARKLCSTKTLLLTCQILGLLINTLASDEKYVVYYRNNLMIPIETQFLRNKKRFLRFLLHF